MALVILSTHLGLREVIQSAKIITTFFYIGTLVTNEQTSNDIISLSDLSTWAIFSEHRNMSFNIPVVIFL